MEDKKLARQISIFSGEKHLLEFMFKCDTNTYERKELKKTYMKYYICCLTDKQLMQLDKEKELIKMRKRIYNKNSTPIKTNKEFIKLLEEWIDWNWDEYYTSAREMWEFLCRLKIGKGEI